MSVAYLIKYQTIDPCQWKIELISDLTNVWYISIT